MNKPTNAQSRNPIALLSKKAYEIVKSVQIKRWPLLIVSSLGFLTAISFAVAVLTYLIFVSYLRDKSPQDEDHKLVTPSGFKSDSSVFALDTLDEKSSRQSSARIRLRLESIDRQRLEVSGTVLIDVDEKLLRLLVDVDTRPAGMSDDELTEQQYLWKVGRGTLLVNRVVFEDGQSHLQIAEQYQNEVCHLVFYDPISHKAHDYKVPLKDLLVPKHSFFGSQSRFSVSIPVTLPLEGQPSSYPQDWYSMEYLVGLGLPEGTSLHIRDKSSIEYEFPIATEVEVAAALGDFTCNIARDDQASDQIQELNLHFSNQSATRRFVFWMIAIASVFVLVFAVYILSYPKIGPSELILDGAAVMLAILPLRTLVVPDNLPTPTRADLWLTLPLALVLAVLSFHIARSVFYEKP